jgi:hypothetical protein
MVDIAWGTPRIIFLRLAILLKLDNVIDSGDASVSFSSVVLLGQLRVEIGKDALGKATPVKLIVDILGFWDADEKRYGFLARLRDSKIGGVDIIGCLPCMASTARNRDSFSRSVVQSALHRRLDAWSMDDRLAPA